MLKSNNILPIHKPEHSFGGIEVIENCSDSYADKAEEGDSPIDDAESLSGQQQELSVNIKNAPIRRRQTPRQLGENSINLCGIKIKPRKTKADKMEEEFLRRHYGEAESKRFPIPKIHVSPVVLNKIRVARGKRVARKMERDFLRRFHAVEFPLGDHQSSYEDIQENKGQKNSRQHMWNEDYGTAKESLAESLEEKKLIESHHDKWLKSVDRLLQYALLEEAKTGLEETVNLFEAVRLQCIGVRLTMPPDSEKMTITHLKFVTEQAGVLARLSSCLNLEPYHISPNTHPDTWRRDRNNDLYIQSLKLYKEASQLLGDDASDQEKFLVSSGIAHAKALRIEYLIARAKHNENFGNVIDINEAHRKRAQTITQELEAAKEGIDTREILEAIDDQIADIHALRLGHNARGTEEMPVADKVLLKLVAA